MQILQGIAVSPGVAIGEALVIGHEGFRIPRRFVARDAVQEEIDRLDLAVQAVAEQIARNRDTVSRQLGEQYGAIFSAHLQMLHDPRLRDELDRLIRQQHYSPEYAVSRAMRRYVKVFESLESGYLAERAHDILDIEKSLLRNLLGRQREELAHIVSPVVILAHNLTPSETANLDPQYVLGFVTEIGGLGGHTAIVAEALGIPAVVGIGPFLTDVSGGDPVIVDGDQGRLVLQPDEPTLARYRQEAEDHRTLAARLQQLRDLPAETLDGVRIHLAANIEFPHEVSACLQRGADGIGLYRTEFLYLHAGKEPTEQVHLEAYARVVRAMGDRPVVVRTFDLGADKMGRAWYEEEEQRNPFLGLRSIRLSLRHPALFRVQLRAILRASALGQVRVMFPMIATLAELRQAKTVLAEIMQELQDEGVPFDRNLPVGMMVEVPSVVTMIDRFIHEVDFVSIGTNDLIQYTLAVDRTSKEVAELYRAGDPAVLRLIERTVQAGDQASVPVSLCGQMSGNVRYTMLLLGLGLRRLSVPPMLLPEVKKICRSVSIEQCAAVACRARSMDSADEIDALLQQELRKAAPELMPC